MRVRFWTRLTSRNRFDFASCLDYNDAVMRNRLSKTASFLLLGIGAAFLLFGVLGGEAELVLQKAIRICLECIGIG